MRMLRWALLGAITALSVSAADLNGRVLDAATGEPIARAHVTVHFFGGAQPGAQLNLISDADGSFHVTNMPTGGFQVQCEKSGYLMNNQAAPAGAVGGDGKQPPMVIKLTAQAAIQGTVVDEQDLPADHVYIQLVRQQVVNGHRQWQAAQGGNTDETGSFRIFGLQSGSYSLAIVTPPPSARRGKQMAYPNFYYPNAADIAAAQPVDLKAGDEAEIKIRLPQPMPAFDVSGVVVNAGPNTNVTLMRQSSAEGEFLRPAGNLRFDPKTQSFRFSHLTPGMYQLTATVHDDEKTSRIASLPISVGDADISGLRLEPTNMNLDGTIRLEADATTAQKVSGFVSVRSDRSTFGTQLDGDGKFHIPMQPGTYRVFPQINQPQICVRSILGGGHDVRDGFTVAAGAAPEPIDIVMTTHCGSIDVSMAQSDTPLPPNLVAWLLRRSGDELVLERQGYQMPRSTDGASHFAISAVPAGDYTVFVWPTDLPIEYANAEYMKQFDSYGQKVSVTDDGKATVSIEKAIVRLSNP